MVAPSAHAPAAAWEPSCLGVPGVPGQKLTWEQWLGVAALQGVGGDTSRRQPVRVCAIRWWLGVQCAVQLACWDV